MMRQTDIPSHVSIRVPFHPIYNNPLTGTLFCGVCQTELEARQFNTRVYLSCPNVGYDWHIARAARA